jgi:hypothetical protein
VEELFLIDDVPAFIKSMATKEFDPNVPVDGHERARYLTSQHLNAQTKEVKPKEEQPATILYVQVAAMSRALDTWDEAKARLVIEYANDAMALFGKTHQRNKVELKRIIEEAEKIISPDSIETLKKRAEKAILRVIYPKQPGLRDVLLLVLG